MKDLIAYISAQWRKYYLQLSTYQVRQEKFKKTCEVEKKIMTDFLHIIKQDEQQKRQTHHIYSYLISLKKHLGLRSLSYQSFVDGQIFSIGHQYNFRPCYENEQKKDDENDGQERRDLGEKLKDCQCFNLITKHQNWWSTDLGVEEFHIENDLQTFYRKNKNLVEKTKCIDGDEEGSLAIWRVSYRSKLMGMLHIFFNEPYMFNEPMIDLLKKQVDLLGHLTSHQHFTEHLQRERKLLHLTFNRLPWAMALVDEQLDIIFSNQSFKNFFGLDEVTGRKISEIADDFRSERWQKIFERVQHGQIEICEEDIIRLNARDSSEKTSEQKEEEQKHWVTWQLYPWINAEKKISGMAFIINPLEQKDASSKNKEVNWNDFVKTSSDLYGIINFSGTFIEVNDSFVKLLGWSHNELCTRPFTDFLHPEDVEKTRQMAFKVMNGSQACVDFENRYRSVDGAYYWLSWNATLIPDKKIIMVTAKNITVKKNVEKEIMRLKERADELSQSKSDYVAYMGHELRTPLNALMGFASVLMEESSLDDQERRYAQHILDSGNHLLAVINNMLDFSKMEFGHFPIVKKHFYLQDVLDPVISMVKAKIEAEQKVQFKLNFDHAGDEILQSKLHGQKENCWGDPLRIKQVLLNLLSNAQKFTKEGQITLSVLGEGQSKGWLSLVVEDTGPGIAPEMVNKMFSPYCQDRENHKNGIGTGLGLVICKKLVELMNGRIDFDTERGKGTTFYVELPIVNVFVEQKEEKSELLSLTEHTDNDNKETLKNELAPILLAEDDEDGRNLLSLYLSKFNFPFDVATNGLEVLSKVKARPEGKPYQLILMDIQMPGMDGFTATKELRQAGHRLPIIALTAHALEEHKQEAMSVGMDDYLRKPIKKQDLLERLEYYYYQHQSDKNSKQEAA